MHIPRWTIPVWVLLTEFVLLSIFPLPDSYAVIKSNPMGILTSYLIFDDWGNIFTLVWSTMTFLLTMLFVGSYWRGHLAVTYLVATNLAGIFAGFVYFESVYSYQTGGGMSAATFGALTLSLGLGVVALANSYSVFHKDVYRQNIRFWALLVFIIFGVYLNSNAFTGFVAKPASQLIHASGILVGFLAGTLSIGVIIWRAKSTEHLSASPGKRVDQAQMPVSQTESSQHKYLIILRGPPTAGKTEVECALEKILGPPDCFFLRLDKAESDLPPNTYTDSMAKRYVLAEIYSGREHLYTPLMWMDRYKQQGRKILSVCLDLDFRTGMVREQQRINEGKDASGGLNNWIVLFFRFYTDPDMTKFAERAGVRETRVDTRGKDPAAIAREILATLDNGC